MSGPFHPLKAYHVLTGLKLKPFIKTDGVSGFHIYIGLEAKSDYDTSQKIAEFICRLIRLPMPDLVTLKASEGYVFGKDSLNAVTVSPIGKGNKSNGVVPVMPNGFADLHNHPKNTPPSSGDLYGLLLKNRLNTGYDMRYILTAAGAVYVLVVMDTTAARLFASKYPQQQVPGYSPLFPDALLNEYREIHYRYGVAEELVMPYILEKYATGVFLLKQSGDGDFAVLRTSVSGEGDNLAFGFLRCQ